MQSSRPAGRGAGDDVAVAVDDGSTSPAPHDHALAHKTYQRGSSSQVHSGVAGPVVRRRGGDGAAGAALRPAYANPGPLGLLSFAGTTFLFSLASVGALTSPAIGLGMAFFFGGLAQLIAGSWEFAQGNTFGATAFSGFGAFWLAQGFIEMPSTGVLAAYAGDEAARRNALGCWLLSWTFFTWVLTFAAHRTNVALFTTLSLTAISFPLLAAGAFSGVKGLEEAGGAFGLAAAAAAYYTALCGLLSLETSHFTLPNPKLL